MFMDDRYCYPNSNVLINKKNIKTEDELLKAEIHYTSYRLYGLQEKGMKGNFDFDHLCRIHKEIFQDYLIGLGKLECVT